MKKWGTNNKVIYAKGGISPLEAGSICASLGEDCVVELIVSTKLDSSWEQLLRTNKVKKITYVYNCTDVSLDFENKQYCYGKLNFYMTETESVCVYNYLVNHYALSSLPDALKNLRNRVGSRLFEEFNHLDRIANYKEECFRD